MSTPYRKVSQVIPEEHRLPEHDWQPRETSTGAPYWYCTRCTTRALDTQRPRPGRCWGKGRYRPVTKAEEKADTEITTNPEGTR